MNTSGWASKTGQWANHARAYGKAHYLDSNGKPLCEQVVNVDGPAVGSFRSTWEPLRSGDEKCKRCERVLSRTTVAIPIYPMRGEFRRRA